MTLIITLLMTKNIDDKNKIKIIMIKNDLQMIW